MGYKGKIAVALIVGFVIGFGSAWLWQNSPTNGVEGDDDLQNELGEIDENDLGEPDQDGRAPVVVEEDSTVEEEVVFVKDQNAGAEVFVSRVSMKLPGWVVIHEDMSGEPGNILGAQRFDSGTYQGSVTLLRPTTAENTYHATLWRDDGDKEFEIGEDQMVSTATVTTFEAY